MRSKEELIPIIEAYQEELLAKYGPLYFSEDLQLNNTNTLLDFIVDFLTKTKIRYKRTGGHRGYTFSKKTNYDTFNFRTRSIGDIYLICKGNYSEDVTLLQVMEVMYQLIEIEEVTLKYKQQLNHKEDGTSEYYFKFYTYICPDINKYVFWPYVGDTEFYRSLYLFSTYNHEYDNRTNSNEFNIEAGDYITLFKQD